MICFHCEDPILAGEKLINGAKHLGEGARTEPAHVECFIRSVFGSAAHQLHDCPCYGGDRDEPAGLTKRQCALLALDAYRALNGGAVALEAHQ